MPATSPGRRSSSPAASISIDWFAALAGSWRLARDIPGQARFDGVAMLTPAGPDRLDYRETGTLQWLDGRSFAAERRYVYRRDGRFLAIDFADGATPGAPFVSLDLSASGSATGRHPCGADLYEVRFTLDLPHCFSTDIAVTGPRKGYRMISRYDRAQLSR